MRVLLVNLKHLYQRRYSSFAYAYIGLLLLLPSLDKDSQEAFGLVWLGVVFSGFLMGGTSRDVINKPFVRCLPGHPLAVRQAVFLIGLAVSLLGGLLFMNHWDTTIWRSPATFCAAVCLSMSMYLVGADIMLIPWVAKGPLAGILFGFAFAAVMVGGAFLHGTFAPLIIQHPLWTILGGVLMGSAVWLQMGLREWSRRLFGIALRCSRPTARREMYAVLERRYARESAALAAADSFFVGCMSRCPDYSVSRYIWGTLYARLGPLVVGWKALIFAFVGVTIVSLYTGWGSIIVFLWVSWVVVPHAWPPLHSAMLVPAGRRQRFLAVVSLAAAITGVVTLWTFVVSSLAVPLSRLIPALEIWGMPLVCRPVPQGIVAVPLVAVPLLATLFVLFPQRLHLAVFVAIPILAPAVSAVMFVVILWLWTLHDVRLVGGLALWIGVAIVFVWMLFGAACFHRTRNWSLIGS